MKYKLNIIVVCTLLISLALITFNVYKNQIRPYHLEKTVFSSKRYQSKLNLLIAKTLKKGSIVLFGDSILESLFFENDNIYNFAIGGETIGLLEKRIVLKEYPDSCTVFIMIGLNDLLFNMPLNNTVQQYENLIKTVSDIKSFQKIFITEILPVNAKGFFIDNDQVNLFIHKLNNELRNIIDKDLTGKFSFVPLHSQFKGQNTFLNEFYTYDGIHLNKNGTSLLKDNILNFLENEQ